MFDKGAFGAVVDEELAPRFLGEGDPVLFGRDAVAGREKIGAEFFAVEEATQNVWSASVDDHRPDAVEAGALGRLDLGRHPPRAVSRGTRPGDSFDFGGDPLHQGDQLRLRVFSRIAVEKSVDVREDDQEVGFDEVGDHGREVVIVPEADLLHHHRVVFIDDRDDAMLQQRHQRVARVEIPPAVGEVVAGEQDLRHLPAAPQRRIAVGPDETALSDGGSGLLEGDGPGTPLDAEIPLAGGDGSARDDHDLVTAFDDGVDVRADRLENGEVESALIGDDAAADLDDDPFYRGKDDLAHTGRCGNG